MVSEGASHPHMTIRLPGRYMNRVAGRPVSTPDDSANSIQRDSEGLSANSIQRDSEGLN